LPAESEPFGVLSEEREGAVVDVRALGWRQGEVQHGGAPGPEVGRLACETGYRLPGQPHHQQEGDGGGQVFPAVIQPGEQPRSGLRRPVLEPDDLDRRLLRAEITRAFDEIAGGEIRGYRPNLGVGKPVGQPFDNPVAVARRVVLGEH